MVYSLRPKIFKTMLKGEVCLRVYKAVRIVGRSGAAEDRMVALGRAQENGAHGIPKPAYTVRVQIQRHNPDQIARDNEFLLQAAKICAEAGTPLPAKEIIRLMEGQRIKESVLAAMENGESANDEAETENDGAGRKNGRWPLAET